ncbi:MAG: metal ABC transporter permease [Acidobacteriota bacterium]|nr:metal ABC transporter permease [Acidobacteriota bacterium]
MFPLILLAGTCAAVAIGFLGVFVLFRRMALVGDALSHVALPGVAVAIVLGIDPLWGALVALGLAAVAIFWLQKATRLYEEAIVGILFSIALAGGVLLLRGRELEAALFGDLSSLSGLDVGLTIGLAVVIFAATLALYRRLALVSFSSDLARANGIDVDRVGLLFFLLLALAVALGVKVVGTLLVGSLVVIPPASGANLARSLRTLALLSVAFAVGAIVLGLVVAHVFRFLPGPVIVLAEGAFFLLSLALRPFRR